MKRIFKDNPRPIRQFLKDEVMAITITLLVIVMASFILFYGSNVGLSDNGDYPRFAKSNYIYALEESQYPFYYFYDKYKMEVEEGNFFDTVNSFFKTSKEGGNPYYSPHFIFIQLSKTLNYIDNKINGNLTTHYDLSWLAIIYVVLYAISLGLILQYLKEEKVFTKIFGAILLLVVFCDQGYLLYFNSFYGEAAQLVLSMLTVGLALIIMKKKGGRLLIIFYYLSVFLLAGSKFTNIPTGILFGIIGLLFLGLNDDIHFKWINLAGFIGAGIGIYLLTQSIPTWMDDVTNYQAVFFGVLKNSETPEEDLEYFGIDKKYAVLKNTHGYMGSNYPINIYTEEFKEDFYENISKGKLLKFYLSHPERFIDKLDVSAKNSGYISPPYLGHYGPEKPRFEFTHRFDLWSRIRLFLQFDNLWVIGFYFVGACVIMMIELIRWRRYKNNKLESLILLIIWLGIIGSTAIHFVIPVVSNGEADLAKHMFGFIHYFDLMVIVIWFWLIVQCVKSKIMLKFTVGVLVFLMAIVAYLNSFVESYEQPEIGAYVQYGTYNNVPLLWQIIHIDEQSFLLFTKDVITRMPYDDGSNSKDQERQLYGSNLWLESDIRVWLNETFIREADLDKAQILESKHINYISIVDKDIKEKGSHPLFWTFVPSVIDWKDNEAYNIIIKDKVFLLDGSEVYSYLVLNNLEIGKTSPYWLRTPMGSNGSMVRYVGADDFILHKDAINEQIGVAPALRISKDINTISGKGTLKEPFVFNEKIK